MKRTTWMVIIIAILLHQGFSGTLEAEAVTWSVKDAAGTVVCNGNQSTPATLPLNCGADLEFQSSGGIARIESIDTGTDDILQLVNTKIVAKKDLVDYVLTFDDTFAPGPSNEYSPIYYRTQMYGSISGNLPNNKIVVTSILEHPVGTVYLTASPTSAPPPQANFNYWDSPFSDSAMNQPRKIIVNAKFSLQKTKYLTFPGGRFIKVSAQPYPDEPAPTRGATPETGATGERVDTVISEIQKALERGSKACVGLSLSDGGCAGIYIVK